MRLLLAASLALVLSACSKPENLSYRIVATKDHDPMCYTQGLEFWNGRLFESGGGYGVSTVREVNPATGEVLRRRPMAKHIFAEGITILNNELWVLSWKEKTAFVLEPDTFKFIRLHEYPGEGWGLTNNGTHLIMSDGSSTLRFIDPKDFSEKKRLTVTDGDREVVMLNELEHVDGVIYANIYQSERIARISAETGKVSGWLDLAALRKQLPQPHRAEELNGIARDPKTGRFLITGKLWPKSFEIEISR
jgi:glutaminyl-peptide cyclotransferase